MNGFNALFGAKQKFESWQRYLAMRETIMQVNSVHRDLLSKDLGAFAGLLHELGSGRLVFGGNADAALKSLQEKAEMLAQKHHRQVVEEQREGPEHTQAPYMLIKIGRALNFRVFVARDDRHRSWRGESFSLLTTPRLPEIGAPSDVMDTIGLIDVLWLNAEATRVVCTFKIEKKHLDLFRNVAAEGSRPLPARPRMRFLSGRTGPAQSGSDGANDETRFP